MREKATRIIGALSIGKPSHGLGGGSGRKVARLRLEGDIAPASLEAVAQGCGVGAIDCDRCRVAGVAVGACIALRASAWRGRDPLLRTAPTMTALALEDLFGPLDIAALGVFVAAWVGIGLVIEYPGRRRPSVSTLMARYRHAWMRELIGREARIFDAAILQNLRDGTAFFASTCLLAIGGVLALAGNPAPLQQIAADLPAAGGAMLGPLLWQTKLLLVAMMLAAAFLRFVWANRLFGYFSVLMGAIPNDAAAPEAGHRATQAAAIGVRAAVNFNRGLRSIYFALAGLAWLLGPVPLLAATFATLGMLWQREFRSTARALLADRPPAEDGGPPP